MDYYKKSIKSLSKEEWEWLKHDRPIYLEFLNNRVYFSCTENISDLENDLEAICQGVFYVEWKNSNNSSCAVYFSNQQDYKQVCS